MSKKPASVVFLAIALAIAACGQPIEPTEAPPVGVATSVPPPPSDAPPAPTPNPCLVPLRQVAQRSQLMVDKLASLREPLLARTYDGWGMLGLARSVNETLRLYSEPIPDLRECPDAAALVERLELLATTAQRHIGVVLAAGFAVATAPRQAMASLFELLPEIVAISEDATALASRHGIEVAVATLPEGADEPLGPLAPLPTPTASPEPPTARIIRQRFFGAGVTLETYTVRGATPNEISNSMNRRGPYSEWLDARAAGTTEARVAFRFTSGTNTNGSCYLYATAEPPVLIRYTVTLPEWTPPAGVASDTIDWWNATVREIATHEKHHVDLYRDAQDDLNTALASSSCGNVESRLGAVWAETNRKQCEFDMREYGYALGLSLEACVTG